MKKPETNETSQYLIKDYKDAETTQVILDMREKLKRDAAVTEELLSMMLLGKPYESGSDFSVVTRTKQNNDTQRCIIK